ncbi:MAG: insulinase family protein [Ignavibacteriae bacterium]|nr:insulinase family protein [Ignavibacteriota bacterium]MCB9215581.1 insulinase family protein [Ignavibacteria bacterium]
MVKRYIFSALTLLLLPAVVFAQQGTEKGVRSVESFDMDGIKVILSPAENQLVSIIVGLEGGIASGETANPAIGDFMTDLITSSGSEDYSKDELRRFLSRTSTRLGGDADFIGVHFSMTSTRARFDEAWNLLSSMIRKPLFDEVEYRNIMQRRVAQAENSWSNPESYAYRMADSLTKIDHPFLARYTYAADVEKVTIPMMKEYYSQLSERSRLIVVVVGDVTKDELMTKLKDFSSWKKGGYKQPEIPRVKPRPAPKTSIVDKPQSPTTYIFASFTGPTSTDPESWPMAIGMNYLRGVLFEEIRTKRNLSYAPFAFYNNSHGQGMGVIGVSTVWPDSSMAIMLNELQKMKDGKFDAADIEKSKQVYTTTYYMREMTNAAKANRLYYNQRYAGDWRKAFSYEDINAVTKADIEKALKKFANNLQVGIVGNQSAVTVAKFEYGESLR